MKELWNMQLEYRMNETPRRTNVWLWFTVPIAALLAVASGGGLFNSGLYIIKKLFIAVP